MDRSSLENGVGISLVELQVELYVGGGWRWVRGGEGGIPSLSDL